MSNLVKWAEKELERIEKDGDGMQEMINKNILEIVKVFSDQGHSGFSAPYALNIIKRLLAWKPITALTGEDDEWNDITRNGDRELYQNNRCSSVFKEILKDGTVITYDIDARIFTRDNGETWFSKGGDRKKITFPYTVPKEPELIYLEEDDFQ